MLDWDEHTDEDWGLFEGQCYACDCWGRINDLSLCESCNAKLERDLIRQRDWDYSGLAFGVPAENREELRRQVIAQFGEAFELIVPPEQVEKERPSRRQRRRRRRKQAATSPKRERSGYSAQEKSTPALLDGLLTCGDHQCPMIAIGENYYCVIEYTDELIGAQQVVDFTPESGKAPARLMFSNGYTLPLLCPDCGESLHIEDDDEFLNIAAGLYLFALAYIPPVEGLPEGGMEFVFVPSLPEGELAGDELPRDSQSLLLHLDSVRGIDR